jgi:hypothetical protein
LVNAALRPDFVAGLPEIAIERAERSRRCQGLVFRRKLVRLGGAVLRNGARNQVVDRMPRAPDIAPAFGRFLSRAPMSISLPMSIAPRGGRLSGSRPAAVIDGRSMLVFSRCCGRRK